jgi:flagellar basal-body rod protein FlgC
MGGIYQAAKIAGSGLKASRSWMNLISNNIANAHAVDTGKKDGEGNFIPYARQVPLFQKVLSESFRRNRVNGDVANGVAVKGIIELKDKVDKVYDPTHPAARLPGTLDAGYVYRPAINTAQELADIRGAASSYEANLSVVEVSNKMIEGALNLGRR